MPAPASLTKIPNSARSAAIEHNMDAIAAVRPHEGRRLSLDETMVNRMQEQFGIRMDQVELRESSQPADMDAKAFAKGNVVQFAPGQFRPDTVQGQQLIQHELAHVAAAQGTACAECLAGQTPLTDLGAIPSCVYTSPEIAAVGLTADETKAAGRAVKVGKYVMFSNGRTGISGGQRGFIKVVADSGTGVILGAQLMCQRATDLISQFTAAVVNGLTAEQLRKVMRPHPTFDEGIGEALEDLEEKLGRR